MGYSYGYQPPKPAHVSADRELIRPLRYASAVSINHWYDHDLSLPDTDALISLFSKEDRRYREHREQFLKVVFPEYNSIILSARELFETLAEPKTGWTSGLVAKAYGECLIKAKAEANFDDSEAANFRRWYEFSFDEVKNRLPAKFKPTVQ